MCNRCRLRLLACHRTCSFMFFFLAILADENVVEQDTFYELKPGDGAERYSVSNATAEACLARCGGSLCAEQSLLGQGGWGTVHGARRLPTAAGSRSCQTSLPCHPPTRQLGWPVLRPSPHILPGSSRPWVQLLGCSLVQLCPLLGEAWALVSEFSNLACLPLHSTAAGACLTHAAAALSVHRSSALARPWHAASARAGLARARTC